MLCVFLSCVQRVVEGSVVGSAGECMLVCMGYVVGGSNVQCTCYIEHGRCGLSCLYAQTVAN